MAQHMVTERKNWDLEEILKTSEEMQEHIRTHQSDNLREYFGDEAIDKANRIIYGQHRRLTIAEFRDIFGIHFSTNMSAKLETVTALSTSCLVNPYCIVRMLDGVNVCAYCFSVGVQDMYRETLTPWLIQNFRILNEIVIPAKYWPDIANDMLRFEAFGDSYTWKQPANYNECAKANKQARCALWSKNPGILRQAIERGYKKAKNMVYVLSSVKLNVEEIEKIFERFPFMDKCFTVYDAEYIKAHCIDINCGGRSCRSCKRCYTKRTGRSVKEKLKSR